MKFKIKSLGVYDYISNLVPLIELGFVFEKSDRVRSSSIFWYKKIKEPEDLIDINSLEELIEFTNKYGDCIVEEGIITLNDPDRYS